MQCMASTVLPKTSALLFSLYLAKRKDQICRICLRSARQFVLTFLHPNGVCTDLYTRVCLLLPLEGPLGYFLYDYPGYHRDSPSGTSLMIYSRNERTKTGSYNFKPLTMGWLCKSVCFARGYRRRLLIPANPSWISLWSYSYLFHYHGCIFPSSATILLTTLVTTATAG